jgi:hypothetical protein
MSAKNNKAIKLGIFLIVLGIAMILIKMDLIGWTVINSLIVLWPFMLVVIGLSILFKNNPVLRTLIWVLFFVIIITHNHLTAGTEYRRVRHGTGTAAIVSGELITFEKEEGVERGGLGLDMAGARIKIHSQTEKLLEASLQNQNVQYSINESKDKSEILFTNNNAKGVKVSTSRKFNNLNEFVLNGDLTWELDLNTDAVDGKFDLTDINVCKIAIESGLGNLQFKLGDKSEKVQIIIDAGLSNIEFELPDTAGVRAKVDAGLSSSSFNKAGWEKRDGYYYSKDYENSDVRIDMDIDIGMGNVSVVFNEV